MMSNEKVELLTWLQGKTEPISKNAMEHHSAPSYTSERIEELYREGYITRGFDVEDGGLVGVYFISDKGRALLQHIEKTRRADAEAKRQQRFKNQVSVAQVLVPAVTFILGLIIEHYAGLISLLSEFLGRGVE